MVAPDWPHKAWLTDLSRLVTGMPWCRSIFPDLLSRGSVSHPALWSLALTAWLLRARCWKTRSYSLRCLGLEVYFSIHHGSYLENLLRTFFFFVCVHFFIAWITGLCLGCSFSAFFGLYTPPRPPLLPSDLKFCQPCRETSFWKYTR